MYFTRLLMRAAALSSLAAAGIGYLSYREGARADALATHGVVTTANVEGIHWREGGASREDYKLDLVFNTRGGVPHHVTVALDEARGRRISADTEHGTVSVQYLPEDADVVQVVGMPLQTWSTRYFLFACAAALLAVMFLCSGWKRYRWRRASSQLPR